MKKLVGIILLCIAPAISHAQACTTTLSAGANVGTAITGAAGGAVICLSNGNYSGFNLSGVSKNPSVTVKALNDFASTFTGTITLENGTNGLTLEGFNLSAVRIIGSSTRNITVRKYVHLASGSKFEIDGPTGTPNILFEDGTHINHMLAMNPASIHLSYSPSSSQQPVATFRRITMDGGCSDGIQTGAPIVIESSRFMNKQVGSCAGDPHTDAVQFMGGTNSIVRGNYFYRNVQVLFGSNATPTNMLVEHNVFDPGPDGERRACQIELNLQDSTVSHNTVLTRSTYGQICVKVGGGNIVKDNIARSLMFEAGGAASVNTGNLYGSGGSSGNLSGNPTFVGGATPSTMAGFMLANGSLGKSAATDGRDIGANNLNTVLPAAPGGLSVQ